MEVTCKEHCKWYNGTDRGITGRLGRHHFVRKDGLRKESSIDVGALPIEISFARGSRRPFVKLPGQVDAAGGVPLNRRRRITKVPLGFIITLRRVVLAVGIRRIHGKDDTSGAVIEVVGHLEEGSVIDEVRHDVGDHLRYGNVVDTVEGIPLPGDGPHPDASTLLDVSDVDIDEAQCIQRLLPREPIITARVGGAENPLDPGPRAHHRFLTLLHRCRRLP